MRSSTRWYLVDSLSSAAGVLSLPGHGWFLAVAAEFRVRIVKHIARLFGRQSACARSTEWPSIATGVFFTSSIYYSLHTSFYYIKTV